MNGLDDQKPSRRLWIIAAVAALVLHAGGVALAITHLNANEDDLYDSDSLTGIGIDMAAEKGEESQLPPGPESEASAASPELAAQKAEVKETDLPQEKPTDEEAERVVTETESKKPKEDDPKIVTQATAASTASVAAEQTAVQRAPDPAMKAKVIAWEKKLVAYLDRHKRYPSERDQKAATPTVRFTIDRLGHVLEMAIEQSSGDEVFDQAALDMVKRSDPLPPPPPLTADNGLTYTVPVIFRINKGKS